MISLTTERETCVPFSFRITALPEAPGALEDAMSGMVDLLDTQLSAAGLTTTALGRARIDTLVPVLVPFKVVHEVLTASNGFRRNRASDTADADVPPVVDALVARSGITARIDYLNRGLKALSEITQSDTTGWFERTARAPPPTDSSTDTTTLSARRPSRSTVHLASSISPPSAKPTSRPGASPELLPVSAEVLHAMMATAAFSQQTPTQEFLLDGASLLFGGGALLAELGGGGKLAKGYTGAATSIWAMKTLMDTYSKVFPNEFVDLRFELAPEEFEEDRDEVGEIQNLLAVARSEPYDLDRTLLDILMQVAGTERAGGFSRWLTKGMSEETLKRSNLMIDYIVDDLVGKATDATVGNSDFLRIPAHDFVADVSDPGWSEVLIGEGNSIEFTDHLTYAPVDVGVTEVAIATQPPGLDAYERAQLEAGNLPVAMAGLEFGGRYIDETVAIAVNPIDVAVEPLTAKVEPGELVRVTAEVIDALDESIEWSVVEGGGRIVQARQIGSNVHEAAVQLPETLERPVVVKAKSTADRSHLRSSIYERAGASRLFTEGIEFAGPCSPDMMELATSDARYAPVTMVRAESFDPSGVQEPGGGSLQISGLIHDRGVGCSHHVAAYVRGLSLPFVAGRGGERVEILREQADRLGDLAEGIAEQAGDPSAMETDERQELMAMVDSGRALAGPDSTDEFDAVFQVYSPNGQIWQSGTLLAPRLTEHTLLGGWQPNAAALVTIQLEGTRADQLEGGATYEAIASTGKLETGLRGSSPVIPTVRAFYTSWHGTHQGIPWRSQRDREACVRGRQQMRQMEVARHLVESGRFDCQFEEHAFEGTTRSVTGRLEGTVSVDSVRSGFVWGRFRLHGSGRLHEVQFEFRRSRDGRVTGDRRVNERTRSGPIQMKGSFAAPNRRANIMRMPGLQTVIVPANRRER